MSAARGRRAPNLVNFWLGVSPRLVPVFAVITAFLAGIPLITITVSENALQPDIREGLRVSSTAYVALVESITGLTINEVAGVDDFGEMRAYAASHDITTRRSLSRQARPFERILEVGLEETREFGEFFARHALDEDSASAISERLDTIEAVGAGALRGLKPLLDGLADLKRSDARDLAELAAGAGGLTGEALTQASALYPPLAEMSAAELERAGAELALIDEHGQVSLMRSQNALAQLDRLGIAPGSADATTIQAIVAADYEDVREAIETLARLDALSIDDPAALGAQFRVVGRMYEAEYLSGASVNDALDEQLDAALGRHLVIRRPGNRVLSADDLGGLTLWHLEKTSKIWKCCSCGWAMRFCSSSVEPGEDDRPRDSFHHRRIGGWAGLQGGLIQHRR